MYATKGKTFNQFVLKEKLHYIFHNKMNETTSSARLYHKRDKKEKRKKKCKREFCIVDVIA